MCLGSCATCAVQLCSCVCCKICCKFGSARSTGVKLLYAFLLLLSSILALAMLGTGVQSWLNDTVSSFWFDLSDPLGDGTVEVISDDLVGTLAVIRIMTAVIAFHLLIAPLVLCVQSTQDARAEIHNGMWPVKMIALLGLIVLMFVLPNGLFVALSSTVYRVGGGLYILINLLYYVEFVYEFYERVFAEDGEQKQLWMYLIVLLTVLSYAWVIFVAVAITVWHHEDGSGSAGEGGGCPEGMAGAWVGVLFTLLVSGLSVSGFVRNAKNGPGSTNGIFQSGAVAAYCMYQVLSAVVNHPDANCRPLADAASTRLRFMGCFFVFIAVCFSAVRKASHGGADGAPTTATTGKGEPGEEEELEDDEKEGVRYSYTTFHLVMCLAAMYIAMMLTSWHTMEESATSDNFILDRSMASVWIKIGTSWLCFFLYFLTLILPPMCPDRQFGDPQDTYP